MTDIRRAFVWATAGRYLVMAINLVSGVVMARLLAPGEYGVSVLGAAVVAIAEAIRALGGGAYIIQKKDLTTDNIRSSFTVNMSVTIILTTALLLLSGPATRYFLMPDLGRYLQVTALGYLTGPFVYPMSALMSRQMAFGTIALIGFVTASVNAVASIFLAMQGFSFMSFAWAGAVSAVAGMLLYFYVWTDRSIFRLNPRGWRSVMAFGAHDSATAVLSQIAESLPYFMFGRLLNAEAVGLCQRAVMLCLVPERVILAGVGAVALPAFSRQIREGRSLKHDYLRAIELITAAQWPALLVLVLLAMAGGRSAHRNSWDGVAVLVSRQPALPDARGERLHSLYAAARGGAGRPFAEHSVRRRPAGASRGGPQHAPDRAVERADLDDAGAVRRRLPLGRGGRGNVEERGLRRHECGRPGGDLDRHGPPRGHADRGGDAGRGARRRRLDRRPVDDEPSAAARGGPAGRRGAAAVGCGRSGPDRRAAAWQMTTSHGCPVLSACARQSASDAGAGSSRTGSAAGCRTASASR